MTGEQSHDEHKRQAHSCVTTAVCVLVLTRVVLLSILKFTATVKTYPVLTVVGTGAVQFGI